MPAMSLPLLTGSRSASSSGLDSAIANSVIPYRSSSTLPPMPSQLVSTDMGSAAEPQTISRSALHPARAAACNPNNTPRWCV